MKTQTHTPKWREASTGNHQGLIVDETGRNVAVVYDKADAPLLAAAPMLLEALQQLLNCVPGAVDAQPDSFKIETSAGYWRTAQNKARAAIAAAQGEKEVA